MNGRAVAAAPLRRSSATSYSLFLVLLVFILSIDVIVKGASAAATTTRQKDSAEIHENNVRRDWLQHLASTTSGKTALSPGGFNCVGCVLVVNVLMRYSYIHEKSITETIEEICSFFPIGESRTLCDTMVTVFGDALIYYVTQGMTPDEICRQGAIFCNNPQCNLFPPSSDESPPETPDSDQQSAINLRLLSEMLTKYVGVSSEIKRPRGGDVADHLPLVDNDNDRFSTIESLRGSSWRGKDCDDQSNTVYPGRKVSAKPNDSSDYNCNGIFGTNPKTGRLYKDELCGQSDPHGVVIFGASAQAHFEIPPKWLEAATINSTTYLDIVFAIQNEMDWPHKSWATGYETDPFVDSIYLHMWERNHCNFKDYQNIGVNGASSDDIVDSSKTVARNASTDYPVLAFYATIGDDICSQHKDLDHMTSPQDFYKNVMTTLRYLDSGILPMGSHLVLVGLVDGRILWNSLHDKLNPSGATYEQVYSWLACLGRNPCWQWLNPNATIRNIASERAAELSDILPQIIANHTFKHFDLAYTPFPLAEMIKQWTQQGGQVSDLIEPVDGFHPSQVGNYVLAKYIWQWLEAEHPTFIGSVNPNNPTIETLFGNQGGYY